MLAGRFVFLVQVLAAPFLSLRRFFTMSLYRKYRPQTFEDVVGQDHIARTLRNALTAQPMRVAHAYLFCGPRGTGKTSSARLLAKCLNCENGPTPTPCNQCEFCVTVSKNQPVMDLTEIDAASHTGVDNVRETIIDRVNIAPVTAKYRIYIIDEVHMLSTSSFNALLKTLEEPPPHAIFILATTEIHKVPTTISSRCQRFDFRRVGPSDIVGRLQMVAEKENLGLDEDAARLIAQQADGALRDALTLLEQVRAFSDDHISQSDVRLVLGTVSRELLSQLMNAVAARDAAGALGLIEQATEEGVAFRQLTRDLIAYTRDALLLTVGFDSAPHDAEERARHQQLAQTMGRARLLRCVETLRAAEKDIKDATDHRLILELALVRAATENTTEAAPPSALAASTNGSAPVAGPPRLRSVEMPAPPVVKTPVAPVEFTPDEVPQKASAPPEAVPEAAPIETESAPAEIESAPAEIAAPIEETIVAEETPIETASVEELAPVEAVAPVEETAPEVVEEAVPVAPKSRKKGRRISNLEEFRELWPAVLVRVKKKIGVTAVAYLHDALPVEFSDKEAILEFRKEFHYEKACEAARRLPFEQVLNECLATPHLLRFRLAAPAPKAPPQEAPPVDDNDDDDEEDILALAQDMFAAQVVGRSGQG